jgi:hypothetical protein
MPVPLPPFDPKKTKLAVPNPPIQTTRLAIRGLQDTVPNLKESIQGADVDAPIKAYLADRLNGLTSSGARIDVHEADHPYGQGGFSLNITVRPVSVGISKSTVFKR